MSREGEGRIMDTPDLPDYCYWLPAVGDTVWMNHDEGEPLGVCVGYLDAPGKPRHGQPVIEYQGPDVDEPWMKKKTGDRSVCHPMFLWPFEPGSEEHKAAQTAGRFP